MKEIMFDILNLILVINVIAAIAVVVYWATKTFPGCSGNCNQGRGICDCKKSS